MVTVLLIPWFSLWFGYYCLRFHRQKVLFWCSQTIWRIWGLENNRDLESHQLRAVNTVVNLHWKERENSRHGAASSLSWVFSQRPPSHTHPGQSSRKTPGWLAWPAPKRLKNKARIKQKWYFMSGVVLYRAENMAAGCCWGQGAPPSSQTFPTPPLGTTQTLNNMNQKQPSCPCDPDQAYTVLKKTLNHLAPMRKRVLPHKVSFSPHGFICTQSKT